MVHFVSNFLKLFSELKFFVKWLKTTTKNQCFNFMKTKMSERLNLGGIPFQKVVIKG